MTAFGAARFVRAASSNLPRTSEVFLQYRSCLRCYTRGRACRLASQLCCGLRPHRTEWGSELKRSFLVEHGRMGVVRTLVRQGVFGDLARSRIELPNVAFEVCRKPDVACAISHQATLSLTRSERNPVAGGTGEQRARVMDPRCAFWGSRSIARDGSDGSARDGSDWRTMVRSKRQTYRKGGMGTQRNGSRSLLLSQLPPLA
jgi:hypothetical protein